MPATNLDGAVFRLTAEDATKQAFDSVLAHIESTKAALGSLGIVAAGLGVAAWAINIVEGAIHAQAELGRLADRAGMTAEALSSMRFAALEGGLSLNEVATLSTRLSKALFEAQDSSTKAGAALQLLGLDAKDLALMPTAQALQIVAARLSEFRDGTAKTAVEMELLGRSGATAGAFLKDLAEQGLAAASVTTENTKAAREAEAQFNRLADASAILKIRLANELLPAINVVADGLLKLGGGTDWSAKIAGLTQVTLAMRALFDPQAAIALRAYEEAAGSSEDATRNWGVELNRASS